MMNRNKTVTAVGKNKLRKRESFQAWMLLLPTVLILWLFLWRSTIFGAVYSFFKMQGYTIIEFCGFDNYRKVITNSQFLPMLWTNLKFVFWSLIIGYLPPLFLAVMLNEMVHFKSGFRLLMYLPTVIPGIAAMLLWKMIYAPNSSGLLNAFLGIFGVDPQMWLNDPDFVVIGLIIYSTWKGFGGSLLLYFASLQGVSTQLYEAALLDGANPLQRFWHVTRPAIDGVLLLNLVSQIIGVFQTMDVPMAMTGGGPIGKSTTLSYQLYRYAFNSGGKATGQAMALGVIIFLMLVGITMFYFWLNRKIQERY